MEQFSESSHCGSVISITWLKINAISTEFDVLTCHVDGVVILWRIGKQMVKDKIYNIKSRHSRNELARLTTIVAISNTDFLVGTEEGSVELCSLTQALPIGGAKNLLDPVVSELEGHRFAVSSLFKASFQNRLIIVSCDVSGEVYFRYADEVSQIYSF